MRRPFLSLVISFILGVSVFNSIHINVVHLLVINLILLFLNLVLCLLFNKEQGIILIIIFFIVGGILTVYYSNDSELLKFQDKSVELHGTVKEVVRIKENYSSYVIYVDNLKIDERYYRINEKMLLNIRGEKVCNIGHKLSILGTMNIPKSNSNPGLFNYKQYLQIHNIKTVMTTNDFLIRVISKDNNNKLENISVTFRNRIEKVFNRVLNKKNSQIMKSIILGDSSYLDEDTVNKFRNLGIAHILAVSGLHIGILYIFLSFIFIKLIGLYKNTSNISIIILLWTYGYLIGFPTSVLRALIMFTCVIGASLSIRRYDAINSLSFGALILLIYNPLWIYDIGFQLSFIATLSLILFTKKIKGIFFSHIIAVQIGISPIMAYHFNLVSIISILANIILIPIMTIGVILGFILLLTSIVSFKVSIIIGKILDIILMMNNYIIDIIDKIPFKTITMYSPTIIDIIVYFIFVFIALRIIRIDKIPDKLNKGIVIYLLCYIALTGISENIANEVKIEFIDVGQGDSALIRTGNRNFLIDTGGSNFGDFDIGDRIVAPYLLKNGITKLDAVFITHYHEDHCQGLLTLMDRIKIDSIIIGYEKYDNELFVDIGNKANEKGIPILKLQKGDIFKVSDNVKFHVLWPKEKYYNIYSENENNLSMVLLFEAYNNNILFTGDIEREVENELIKDYKVNNIKILKVPHHGSDTSSTEEFVRYVKPDIAVISVGKNHFGQPNGEVLERYVGNNTEIYRTDIDGLITIKVNTNGIVVYPYLKDKPTIKELLFIHRLELLFSICYVIIGVFLIKG